MRKKELLVIVVFFVLAQVVVFRNYFFKNQIPFSANLLVSFYQPWYSYSTSSVANKPFGFDSLRIFYPLRSLTIDQIKHGQWPLWNPYNFSGNTLLATYQSAVFHPLSFLFFIFPPIDAWSLIVISQPLLAGVFMYLFLRSLLISKRSSIFASFAFAFSGYMIVLWEESFMSVYSSVFLPLILFAILNFFKKMNVKYFITITLGLAFSILSGWFQTTLYVFIFTILWTLFLYMFFYKNKTKELIFTFISLSLSFLISSIHLIPAIEAYINSARGTTDVKFIFDDYLSPLYHLITFIIPDIFGNPSAYNYFGKGFYYEKVIFVGIPTFLFAIYSLLSFDKKNYTKNFFSVFFFVFLSLGFSLPTSWAILYYLKLPFISTILPSRIFFLSTFCICVLAGYGLDAFIEKPHKKKIVTVLIAIFLSLITSLLAVAVHYYAIRTEKNAFVHFITSVRNSILPIWIFALTSVLVIFYLKIKKNQNLFYAGILITSIFSSFYFANKYLFFSDRKNVFPNTPVISELKKMVGVNRVWGYKNAHIENNFLTYFKIFSPEGYDSLYIRRYGELLYAANNKGKFSHQIPRTDALIPTEKYENGIDSNSYRKTLLSLLGIKYVIENNEDFKDLKSRKDEALLSIWNDGKFTIQEYKNALPRAFLANNFIQATSEQEILNHLFNGRFNLAETVILKESPGNFHSKESFTGSTDIVEYSPNKITIRTKSNSYAFLFLSDNYYPGWEARVDGNKTKIYRADYAFRSVVVPPGMHSVVFEYKPRSFFLGLVGTFFGTILLLITSGIIYYRKSWKKYKLLGKSSY